MLVEILYFAGCPNYRDARALVERVSRDLDIQPEIQMLEVRDLETAERLSFLGSPTIRVDGRDVEPGADSRDTFVFACRVYRPDTGPRGLPHEAWLRDALSAA